MLLHDRHLYSADLKITPALILAQPGDNMTVLFLNTQQEQETLLAIEEQTIEQNT